MRTFVVASVFAVCLLATSSGALAEPTSIQSTLKDMGYVSLPLERHPNGTWSVKGLIHGEEMRFQLDLSNDDSLFDIRALRKLRINFERTEIVIPTPRLNAQIERGRILGLEFQGRSTGAMTIHAGDIDAIYRVKPGVDGPDAVLGAGFLAQYGGMLDFSQKLLHLKFK